MSWSLLSLHQIWSQNLILSRPHLRPFTPSSSQIMVHCQSLFLNIILNNIVVLFSSKISNGLFSENINLTFSTQLALIFKKNKTMDLASSYLSACFSESLESLYNVGKMIGSGMFGCVYEGTRKFDGKRVHLTELYKHFANACIKTYVKQLTDGQLLEYCYCY